MLVRHRQDVRRHQEDKRDVADDVGEDEHRDTELHERKEGHEVHVGADEGGPDLGGDVRLAERHHHDERAREPSDQVPIHLLRLRQLSPHHVITQHRTSEKTQLGEDCVTIPSIAIATSATPAVLHPTLHPEIRADEGEEKDEETRKDECTEQVQDHHDDE